MYNLHPEHLADLRKSALTDQTIVRCGFESLRPADIPVQGVESAYRLPYFSLSGAREPFERIRLFPPVKRKTGTQKYAQSSGTYPQLYAPPIIPWSDMVANTLVPFAITEGEKKAVALSQAGIASLGVGGVWNWIIQESGQSLLLPSLDLFTWNGRTVDIVPDSDTWAEEKAQALQGMYALGMELAQRGAQVRIVQFTEDGHGKVGADDWIQSCRYEVKEQWACLTRLPLDHDRFVKTAAWYQSWKAKRAELAALAKREEAFEVLELGGEYAVVYPGLQVTFNFMNIESAARGVQAEVSVLIANRSIAGITDLNLKSESGKTNLARGLSHYVKEIPWKQCLERACTAVLERVRQGEPVEPLRIQPSQHVSFLLNPIIYEGHQTLIFAPGGSMKSYLALYFALLLEGGLTDGHLRALKCKTLYLDWELDRATTQSRMSLLAAGDPRLAGLHPHYRRCVAPLHVDVASIAREVKQKDIRCLVIDSAALACGGDLHSPDAPIQLQQALKRIGCASLVLAHVAKNTIDGQNRSTYGSVFFRELSRNVFELDRPSLEVTEVILSQTGNGCKNSFGRIVDPIGFRIEFESDKTIVDQFAIEDEPDGYGMEKATLRTRLVDLLKDGLPRSAEELEVILKHPRRSIQTILSRHRGTTFELVGKQGEFKWVLL